MSADKLTVEEFRELCRDASREAIMSVLELMRNSSSDTVRLNSAKFVVEQAAFDNRREMPQIADDDDFDEMPRKERIRLLQEALEKEQLQDAQEMFESMEVTK